MYEWAIRDIGMEPLRDSCGTKCACCLQEGTTEFCICSSVHVYSLAASMMNTSV